MLVYTNSDFLIYYLSKKRVLITLWRKNCFTVGNFQKQMRIWLELSYQYSCKVCLFNQSNFIWKIPNEIYVWLEKEINRKLYVNGINQLYFICSNKSKEKANLKDMFSQIDSVFLPRYYNNLHDALQWIYSNRSKRKQIEKSYVEQVYKLQTTPKNSINHQKIDVKLFFLSDEETEKIRNCLIQDQLDFIQQNYQKFLRLNLSESTVLHLVLRAYNNKQIAKILFISPKTVKTHRHNISVKLESSHWTDLSKYEVFYRIG